MSGAIRIVDMPDLGTVTDNELGGRGACRFWPFQCAGVAQLLP